MYGVNLSYLLKFFGIFFNFMLRVNVFNKLGKFL